MTRKKGDLPFDLPFLWGGTRIVRWTGTRAIDVSAPAIVHGAAETIQRAELLAISEGVERAACQSVRPDLWRRNSDRDVKTATARYGWSRERHGRSGRPYCVGFDLIRRTRCLVPSERVIVDGPEEFRGSGHHEKTYTGAASHDTLGRAILHGTLEVLARHAFMTAWYRCRPLPSISLPKRLEGASEVRRRYLVDHRIAIDAFDLSGNMKLPVVLLRLEGRCANGNWPKHGRLFIPAAGLTPDEALSHALTLSCMRYATIGLDRSPERNPLDVGAVRRTARRAPYWPLIARYLDRRRSEGDDFSHSGMTVALDDLPGHRQRSDGSKVAFLRDTLDEMQFNWLAVSLSDVIADHCSFAVVKTIVPEAVGVCMSRGEVEFGKLRWDGDAAGPLNPAPHPLY